MIHLKQKKKKKIHFEKIKPILFPLFLPKTSFKRFLCGFHIMNITEGEKIAVPFGISPLKGRKIRICFSRGEGDNMITF